MSARWLRGRLSGVGLILGYHRIAEDPVDPFGVCVTPAHFAEHLDVLSRHARPVRLADLVGGLRTGALPRGAVAVTLDDGYADALYQAKPLLEAHGIPATVFVTTGSLGRDFWWDEIVRLLSPADLPELLSLRIQGKTHEWILAVDRTASSATADQARRSVQQELYRLLLPMRSEDRDLVMSDLTSWSTAGPSGDSARRSLDADEVVQLAQDRLVEVGAHTVTHPLLAAQPMSAQRAECLESKHQLESILGWPVAGFSYPNGSYTQHSTRLVQEIGFSYACTSVGDVARAGTDPYKVPRFWVPDYDGGAFARWLRWWLPN